MKNRFKPALWLSFFGCLSVLALLSPLAPAPAVGAAPPLPRTASLVNQIAVGRCSVANLPSDLNDFVASERRVGLVMDARPFALNQTVGRLAFNGRAGRVTILNMNPFVYNYEITVTQKEIVTTALNDFIGLLLPPTLGKGVGFQSGSAGVTNARRAAGASRLQLIEERLRNYRPANCNAGADACDAINAMFMAFDRIRGSDVLVNGTANHRLVTAPQLGGVPAEQAYTSYTADLAKLRDVEADSYTTCRRAEELNLKLNGLDLATHFRQLQEAQAAISNVTNLVNDLKNNQIAAYRKDAVLKEVKNVPRCSGYNCIDQLEQYADAVIAVLSEAEEKLDDRLENAEEMRAMLRLTEDMKTKVGLFARSFDVERKFELSDATVALNRKALQANQQSGQTARSTGNQSGVAGGGIARMQSTTDLPSGSLAPGAASGGPAPGFGSIGNSLTTPGTGFQSGQPGTAPPPTPTPTPAARPGGNNLAPAGQVNEVIRIGRPRFALSGGLVYSPLPRRTFTSVKGFARDAQGKPTGDGSANIVGFGENSQRRLMPMVMLNTRLADFDDASLFFTTGVSAKYDDNVDIEYLFGPSVGLLNNRILFTAGVYGGMTQNLVADVAVGDVIPDAAGDAKLFRKSRTWKPGFSVSYFFTRPPKQAEGGAGGSTATASASGPGATATASVSGTAAQTRADNLKSEIRIGSIPFNLAVGMIYTTLEQRTYNPVVGRARNRQGELTNGNTLTRIVGLTSSSDTRLTPAVLLHSRLTNFGRHDFYFTTGLTGKKTDNNFDIEYLLGGSVNLYQRKFFLTFGAFAGKQQTLGGDFFEGAALAKTQGVTTQNRYVWKPAFSFSYDVTRFMPRAR
jgi:hypothetical protein